MTTTISDHEKEWSAFVYAQLIITFVVCLCMKQVSRDMGQLSGIMCLNNCWKGCIFNKLWFLMVCLILPHNAGKLSMLKEDFVSFQGSNLPLEWGKY